MTSKIKDENEESSAEQFFIELGDYTIPINEKLIEPIEYAINKFEFRIKCCEDEIYDAEDQIKHFTNKIIEYKDLINKIKG